MAREHLVWQRMFGDDPYVVNLQLRNTDRGCGVHTHDFPQLLLMVEGQCLHVINRQRQVLTPGDVVAVRLDDVHSFGPATDARYTMLIMSFPASVLEHLAAVYYGGSTAFWGGTGPVPRTDSIGERAAALEKRFVKLATSPKTALARDSLLLQILEDIQDSSGGAPPDTAADMPDWLRRAYTEIRLRPNLREGVPAFVRIACRSHEHVTRETRRYLGKSPVAIVTEARMERACRRLATEDVTIAAVAGDVGFSSSSHFHRTFMAATGVTPRQYRLRHRRGEVV